MTKPGCRRHRAWCGGHVLLPRWYAVLWCESVIAVRCCMAWGKFRKLLHVLTTRHLPPKIRDNVYETSIMLHGSETLGPNHPELQRFRLNDRTMTQWSCGIKKQRPNTLSFTTTETWHWGYYIGPSLSATQGLYSLRRRRLTGILLT